ncbi:hypothetical protein FH969_14040 [Miniimonas arenae]|uniref:Uncharacterized protein n=1 Tax=Miniimonas arenae TaxID=676201 RepID=A0A5C5B8V7_9MICO|nr:MULTISPECIES: hypothetical protein [Miniimonas]TNU72949.1 hypothetical protein FH969_14040 [Miniimonas arenae]
MRTWQKAPVVCAIALAVVLGTVGSSAPPPKDPALEPTLLEEVASDFPNAIEVLRTPEVNEALQDEDVRLAVEETLQSALNAPEGSSVSWTWVPLEDIEWAGPIDDWMPTIEPDESDFQQIDRSQVEAIDSTLTALSEVVTPLSVGTCSSVYWYRVLWTQAFDSNVRASCYAAVGDNQTSITATGTIPGYSAAAGVCPAKTRGRVWWSNTGYWTPRWSAWRGPVSSSTTCYYFSDIPSPIIITVVQLSSCGLSVCPASAPLSTQNESLWGAPERGTASWSGQ